MRKLNEREYRRSVNAATLLYVCGWLPGVIANWRLRRRYHLWAGVNEQKLPWAGVVEFQFWAFTVTLPLLALLVCLLALFGRTGASPGPAWRPPRPKPWLASPVPRTLAIPTAISAPAQSVTPPAQYLIHVPGVSVTPFRLGSSPGSYFYMLTMRAMWGGYRIYAAPLRPQSGQDCLMGSPECRPRDPQQVRALTVGMLERRMVRFGHPFYMSSFAKTLHGPGHRSDRFCLLTFGASHGSIGFVLSLQTPATCAAATKAATPVVDALLTKIY